MKRLLAAATLAFLPALATAQLPQPGLGEIMLQVAGTGETRSKPDFATLRFTVVGKGVTMDAARGAAQSRLDQLAAALASHGVPRTALRAQPATAAIGFVGNEAYGEDMPTSMLGAESAASKISTLVAQLTLDDVTQIAAVRTLIEQRAEGAVLQQTLCLRNDTAARRAAIAAAVAKARVDADSYASALGMRVARTVRVADRGASGGQSGAMAAVLRNMTGQVDSGMVTTSVTVVQDVVLAPK